MKCPECNGKTKVLKVTNSLTDHKITRYRRCVDCDYRFNTDEILQDFINSVKKQLNKL